MSIAYWHGTSLLSKFEYVVGLCSFPDEEQLLQFVDDVSLVQKRNDFFRTVIPILAEETQNTHANVNMVVLVQYSRIIKTLCRWYWYSINAL